MPAAMYAAMLAAMAAAIIRDASAPKILTQGLSRVSNHKHRRKVSRENMDCRLGRVSKWLDHSHRRGLNAWKYHGLHGGLNALLAFCVLRRCSLNLSLRKMPTLDLGLNIVTDFLLWLNDA